MTILDEVLSLCSYFNVAADFTYIGNLHYLVGITVAVKCDSCPVFTREMIRLVLLQKSLRYPAIAQKLSCTSCV